MQIYPKQSTGLSKIAWTLKQNWPFTVEKTIVGSLMMEWGHPPVWGMVSRTYGERHVLVTNVLLNMTQPPCGWQELCDTSGQCTMCRNEVCHFWCEACKTGYGFPTLLYSAIVSHVLRCQCHKIVVLLWVWVSDHHLQLALNVA